MGFIQCVTNTLNILKSFKNNLLKSNPPQNTVQTTEQSLPCLSKQHIDYKLLYLYSAIYKLVKKRRYMHPNYFVNITEFYFILAAINYTKKNKSTDPA